MTVEKTNISSIVALPSELDCTIDPITIFTLPHPSNNQSKKRVKLLQGLNEQLYELRSHDFSNGCSYSTKSDLATEKYHFTADNLPLKSIFLTNQSDRSDGHIIESGTFEFTTKYDLTFNLIGVFYKDSIATEEQEYTKDSTGVDIPNGRVEEPQCLTARDFHDLLIDTHDTEWSKVPLILLERSLSNIAEQIEEVGEIYYRLSTEKAIKYLLQKIEKIAKNFPKSLPLPTNLPPEVFESLRIIMSVNLLISLIPKVAYKKLVAYSPRANIEDDVQLDIEKAFRIYNEHQKLKNGLDKQQELQLRAAMTVGLSTTSSKKAPQKVVKKTTATAKITKVKSGKGSIDGFFKSTKK